MKTSNREHKMQLIFKGDDYSLYEQMKSIKDISIREFVREAVREKLAKQHVYVTSTNNVIVDNIRKELNKIGIRIWVDPVTGDLELYHVDSALNKSSQAPSFPEVSKSVEIVKEKHVHTEEPIEKVSENPKEEPCLHVSNKNVEFSLEEPTEADVSHSWHGSKSFSNLPPLSALEEPQSVISQESYSSDYADHSHKHDQKSFSTTNQKNKMLKAFKSFRM